MRKKMGLTSIFKIIIDPTRSSSSTSLSSFSYPNNSPSWAWPSCKHPRTLSFRVAGGDQDVYKTVNSIYIETSDQSWLTNTPSSAAEDEKVEEHSVTDQIIPTALEEEEEEEEEEEITKDDDDSEGCIESTVIHGLRSDRLFFDPGGDSSSILVESTTTEPEPATAEVTSLMVEEEERVPFKESVAEEMESENPYVDFRVSMEEMVKAHGLNDWDCLEELLGWYLRMNGKRTHVFILGAFVDLLLDLASPSPSSSPSFCSSTSSTSSSCFCTYSSPTTTTTSSSSAKFVSKDQNKEVKRENQNDDDHEEEEEEEEKGSC